MNCRRPFCFALTILTTLALSIPGEVGAQQAQSAGKITAVVPIVDVVRGPQQVPASNSTQVFWGDVINTGHLARARMALNDGSILNVGSDSNLTIKKHDASQQQTDLELNYGRVRARAVKLVKPDGHYEIRTPTGVAGVVGTDFEIQSENDTTRVVVFEGKVRFCGLRKKSKEEKQAEEAGNQTPEQGKRRKEELLPCVIVAAGATSSVRFNEAPSQPVPATPLTVTEAMNSTAPSGGGAGGGAAGGAAGGAGGGAAGAGAATVAGIGAGVGAGVAMAVVRGVATTKTCSTGGGTTGGGAVGRRPGASCSGITPGLVNGQRQ